jgi:hypothetical protein
MSDHARPVGLGYLRVHLLMTAAELELTRERLASFAQAEGYALAGVFVERVDTAPSAFHALVNAVKRHDDREVLVPSTRHLAVLGVPPTLTSYLERCTGARVLAADRGQ